MTLTPSRPRPVRVLLLFALLAGLAASSSCGRTEKGLYPVRGQVFYEGKPASGAVVFFHRQGDPGPKDGSTGGGHATDLASGNVGADGSFELTTFNRGKGAPAGRYAVTVSWTSPSPGGGDSGGKSLLPPRYLYPAYSKLVAEVKEGDNELPPFQLKR
jgi:hypothetical protein